MDNNHVAERLTDYLLGEVTVQERDAIRAHLVICRDCAAEEAALRRSITHVEDALRSDRRAPEDFTERVMRWIGADQHSASGKITQPSVKQDPLPQFGTARRSWKWAIALTISLLGTMAFQRELAWRDHPAGQHAPPGTPMSATPRGTSPAAVTLTLPAMLAVYREVSRSPAVSEVGTTDPAGIAAALTPRVGFRVAPVDLAAQGAPTRGARVSRLLGRPVAVSVLMFQGRLLTLYQMQSRGVSLPAMPVMNAVGKRLLCGRAQDCHLVAWRSGGRLFVLAGNVSDRQLVMLASAIPNQGEVA